MLFALGIGYFVFDEVPTATMLAGAALVMLAGILIIWRGRQPGLEHAEARKAMTLQGWDGMSSGQHILCNTRALPDKSFKTRGTLLALNGRWRPYQRLRSAVYASPSFINISIV